MKVSGTISCAGNSECLVDVASASSALVSGSMTGSDIRLVIAETLQLLGSVSTSGQGYTERAGDGKGSEPGYHSSSYTSGYRVSGSGGGHGGNGANACYRYSTSYGSIPSGALPNASTRLARTLDRKSSPACTSPAHPVCMHGNTCARRDQRHLLIPLLGHRWRKLRQQQLSSDLREWRRPKLLLFRQLQQLWGRGKRWWQDLHERKLDRDYVRRNDIC
jgi:hypothetical protein